ncbi:acetyl-CoA carboxylase carboxyltransferase subunit alpha/beta [Lentzea nigeriaca]|uniref:acetyl-CoA carboxylase carboxyltransferase subunit alpha/beta n=1 Tax=Lentzea nigeriaca TaxID=1128665 RepID=UPI0027DCC6E3|nr:acetyl-CoA carboxylase carboxyltransferase subunit alpha/beta [Lentzea nigeriaca]MBM7856346.1 acetyl-CoA carboxylase carboxyl transferase subunit beta [Lentzea nigeriaca]
MTTAQALDWQRCAGCRTLHYAKKLARCLGVCPDCEHHHRLTAAERIEQLVDAGTFVPAGTRAVVTDLLRFPDYRARLAKARAETGLPDAVLCGTGRIAGRAVSLAVMDFRFMGGSLGAAVGELITRAAETAVRKRVPLLIVTASGGARMQEGVLALMQMAKVSQAIAGVRDAGLLTVSLVTDPTYGGVAASFATNCDVIVVEQGARMGFAGPRVIEQTIKQKLPADFQTASFLLAHGQVDAVLHRRDLPGWLGALFAATSGGAEWVTERDDDGLVRSAKSLPSRDSWDVVTAARDTARPTALDHISTALDGFVELRGDRLAADCPAIVAGFATLDGRPVAVVGHQKGHETAELVARNFGMPRPEGYRKALRVMELAARLRIPILAFVDTPGAFPGQDAEEHGQSLAIAANVLRMFELDTPIVTVVTGEGGSGGALALAVADRVLMFENSVYSVISPEGCSSILWGDAKAAPEAARALRITARELLELGVVDGVLPEPADIRTAVTAAFAELNGREDLIGSRRDRFRAFGTVGLLISEGGEVDG